MTAQTLGIARDGRGPVYHRHIEQGSAEWMALRCGVLTASEVKLIVGVEGGGSVTVYRATGVRPEKLTPKREQALDLIGKREGSVRDLCFLADVSDGVIRGLIKDGALEAHRTVVPITYRSIMDDKTTAHMYELLAQRVTKYVEPFFESYDMERGKFDEEHARAKYAQEYGPVEEVGFITNDKYGFTIGYSPDGLVGDEGLIEAKSRVQKWQMQTFIEYVANQTVPSDFLMQCHTGMSVSERHWLDFISYSGGMKMAVVRCHADPVIEDAIGNAAAEFERRLAEKLEIYENLIASDVRLIPTERLLML